MGITGLLPFVRKASRPVTLEELRGSVAAVDTYCWLHKGAYACAEKLVRGEDCDSYVQYVLRLVRQLQRHGITPVMVFDGRNLPAKEVTERKRRESRAKYRAMAKELLREGRDREARDCCARCIDITPVMARKVLAACRGAGADVLVAPYEADAQLAYLATNGFVNLVLTEDSDLLMFGCPRVVFKLDANGSGVLYEQDKLHLALGVPSHKFSADTFAASCVLAGCDYLESLPGIGIGKAFKFFSLTVDTDTRAVLKKLPTYLRMSSLEVSDEYRDGFMRALETIRHQLVLCPRERLLRPLLLPTDGSPPSSRPHCGPPLPDSVALQQAWGNVCVASGDTVDHFCPDAAPMKKNSIWNRSAPRCKELPPLVEVECGEKAWGASSQNTKKSTPQSKKKLRKEVTVPFLMKDEEPSENISDLLSLYKCRSLSNDADTRKTSKFFKSASESSSSVNPFAKPSNHRSVNGDDPAVSDDTATNRTVESFPKNPFAKSLVKPKEEAKVLDTVEDESMMDASFCEASEIADTQVYNQSQSSPNHTLDTSMHEDLTRNSDSGNEILQESLSTSSSITNDFKPPRRNIIVLSRFFKPAEDIKPNEIEAGAYKEKESTTEAELSESPGKENVEAESPVRTEKESSCKRKLTLLDSNVHGLKHNKKPFIKVQPQNSKKNVKGGAALKQRSVKDMFSRGFATR